MDLKQVISINLRKIRHQQGLSQRQLSEKTGLDEKFISQLENKPRHVSTRTLARLADGLGVEAAGLLMKDEALGVKAVEIDKELVVGVEESIRILRVFRERLIK